MKTKLLYFWDLLRTSFWFLPVFLILLSIGLAFTLVYVDARFQIEFSGISALFLSGGPDSARTILSTIAGAMLGVAGTVFSITLVALTLASSQFGSRLLRNFMHDRLNQTVLGTYIATFTYCLLILRTVKSGDELQFVPNISVLFGIILAVANILLLVIFIHHISISIQADQVISDISNKLSKSISKLFPEEIGVENDDENKKIADNLRQELSSRSSVLSSKSGYLQAVDDQTLINLANEYDLLIELHYRPGGFIVRNEQIALVHSRKEIETDILERLENACILGAKRTPIQDAEFAIHQMVEIASRALSPGINDPYTAITCIDKLTETICFLTSVSFPSAYRFNSEKQMRVIADPLTFDGMMDACFHQIRQYGKAVPAVLIRLMEAYVKIKGFIKTEKQQATLTRHAELLLFTAKNADLHPNDLKDLETRYAKMKG